MLFGGGRLPPPASLALPPPRALWARRGTSGAPENETYSKERILFGSRNDDRGRMLKILPGDVRLLVSPGGLQRVLPLPSRVPEVRTVSTSSIKPS